MKELEEAYRRLAHWSPESGFPCEPDYEDSKEDLDNAPFLSEMYLYNLLGKEDARTLLALVRKLAEAGGLDVMAQYRIRYERDQG